MAVPFGKYLLLRKLASGGMGQIFLARERGAGFERLVVLKLVLPHLAEDEEFLDMFLKEAQLVFPLRHPHLVTLHEVAEVEGRLVLVLEWVQGDDLRRLEKAAVRAGRPLRPEHVVRVVADAAAGLHYAHEARDAAGRPLGLVHRDVSPQNVLVGFDGAVKIIDFGVAKAAGSTRHTASGILKGKYPYMSPEQAAGGTVDARSDQFALGIVLWEGLTGRRLFKGDNDLMTLRLVRECQVPPPSRVNPGVPAALDPLVLRALSADPDARYPDCGALRLALEDFVLEARLPASSAHLVAFLRDLYRERIQAESDPAALDALTGDVDLEGMGTPSRSSVRSLELREQLSVAAPAPSRTPTAGGTRAETSRATAATIPTNLTAPTPAHVSGRGRRALAAVAAGVVLLGLAGVAAVVMRPAARAAAQGAEQSAAQHALTPAPVAPAAVAAAPAAVAAPPAAAPAAPAARVQVEVRSVPTGALVLVDGAEVGRTPHALQLVEGGAPARVTVRAAGYAAAERTVGAEDAPALTLRLQRAAAPRPKAPSLDIKHGR